MLKNTLSYVGNYLLNFLIAIDQLVNAILGGRPDHTISGRIGYHAMHGKIWALILEKVINWIFFDRNHCRDNIEWDILKRDGISKRKD